MRRARFSGVAAGWIVVTAACTAAAAPFDYYVLSLSWAPGFCAQPGEAGRNPAECGAGKKVGFIVHGLWPEPESGRAPENCGSKRKVTKPVIELMLPEMLSAGLIRHEWTTHGSCSGLNPYDFFSSMQQARAAVQVPVQILSLEADTTETPAAVEEQFGEANPAFPRGAFRVACRNDAMEEVRVCFDKNLKGRACPANAGECRSRQIMIRAPQ